ncbi:DUF302 domain-containing protein [Caballeronia sp. dw_19]|uniref:DUF302 domain-containing protein n=1 Tax=Caballeronia sp. dw_19 TaxID=2719791 RepID=UPI001BD49D6F|nr:DUF302 domain-containing protein [Caballeronia sp. dw_19]
MSEPIISSHMISIDHIQIRSARPFDEVRRKLEETVPQLDRAIMAALNEGDQARAQDYGDRGPKLSIFLVRDHGALLQIAGAARKALQYEIGNPLTASKMTRHQLAAALYAPLRVALYEDEQGRGVFEYDRPSSFFGQFGDEQITEIGRDLDDELRAALLGAAS